VTVNLHIDPPQAHTVNIEPLTPTDWDSAYIHTPTMLHALVQPLTKTIQSSNFMLAF